MSHIIITNGDLVALEVERKGFMASPSQDEPIPEFQEKVTQTRVAFYRDTMSDGDPHKRALPCDFSTRCVFRLECEVPGPLVYGSRVRLVHELTDSKLVASEIIESCSSFEQLNEVAMDITAPQPLGRVKRQTSGQDVTPVKSMMMKKSSSRASFRKISSAHSFNFSVNESGKDLDSDGPAESKLLCTFLRKRNKPYKNFEDIWILSSRYKLRLEGEPIYAEDSVMFLSVAYSHFPLGFTTDYVSRSGFVGLVSPPKKKFSFRVLHLRSSALNQARVKSILSGDFVRLNHQELEGYLVSRTDDEKELQSVVSPLGRAAMKKNKSRDLTDSVYIRENAKLSGDSIFQFLHKDHLNFGPITVSDTIQFRHALTGQYLCLRRVGFQRENEPVRWVVATSTIPTDDCNFVMHSPDNPDPQPEVIALTGAILFNQNVSFVHVYSDCCFAVPYEDEVLPPTRIYRHDFPLTAAPGSMAKSEVYKMTPVPADQVHDTLYIGRIIPLVLAATANIQLSHTSDLYLPVFRHLCVGMETLIKWVFHLSESDNSFIETPKLTGLDPKANAPFSSSLVAWLNKPSAEFNSAHYIIEVRTRESCSSAVHGLPSRFRQNLLANSSTIDLLMNLCNIVYTLYKIRDSMREIHLGDEDAEAKNSAYEIPVLVANTCILTHDLLFLTMLKNTDVAIRCISRTGALLSLFAHACIKWNPPVAELLCTALESTDSEEVFLVEESLSSLTEFDVRLFVRQMDDLRKSGKDASHIVELMHTLSKYGTPSTLKRFQDYIVGETFDPVQTPSFGNLLDDYGERNDSAFFCTRYNTDINDWELCLSDTDFQLRTEKPSPEVIRIYFEKEYEAMKRVFLTYDTDNNGYIDFYECFDFLEEIGIAGAALSKELFRLHNSTLHDIVLWWFEKRKIYFSTYCTVLNYCSMDDIHALLREMHPLVELAQHEEKAEFSSGITPGFFRIFSEGSAHCTAIDESREPPPKFSLGEAEEHFKKQLNQRVWAYRITDLMDLFKLEDHSDSHRKKNIMKLSPELAFLQQPSKLSSVTGGSSLWTPILDILEDNGNKASWFRMCLKLFCQLCGNKNIGSQVVVNKLIPADCLLNLLTGESLSNGDKAIACQLLCDLFVLHDFVFSVASLTPSQCVYCSIESEDLTTQSVAMGKLFNENCVYAVNDRVVSFNLRLALKNFILREISKFSLISTPEEMEAKNAYQLALLQLLKSLLGIGFFSEDFSTAEVADTVNEISALKAMLISKLKMFFEGLNDIKRLSEGLKSNIDAELANGDISPEEHSALLHSLEKTSSGNFGIELEDPIGKYFSVCFTQSSTISILHSILDLVIYFFDSNQMDSLKRILNVLTNFKKIFPDLGDVTDIRTVQTDTVVVNFDKYVTKQCYSKDSQQDIDDIDVLMKAFYFEDKSLRGKLLNFMEVFLFKTDISRSIDEISYCASSDEAVGKRIFDLLRHSTLNYANEFDHIETKNRLLPTPLKDDSSSLNVRPSVEVEGKAMHLVQNVSTLKQLHILETMSCLLGSMKSVILNEHIVLRTVVKSKSILAAFRKPSKQESLSDLRRQSFLEARTPPPRARSSIFSSSKAYSAVDQQEIKHFAEDFYEFLPRRFCSYAAHLKEFTVDLLTVLQRVTMDEATQHMYSISYLSKYCRTFIEQVMDFLAVVGPSDPEVFANCWVPFGKVIQHFFGLFQSVYIILEIIYQYHPALEDLVTRDVFRSITIAADVILVSPTCWCIRLLNSMLLNEGQDSMFELAADYADSFLMNPENEKVVALSLDGKFESPLMQAHTHILQLICTRYNYDTADDLEARLTELFPLDYCINYLENDECFLVSKSLLLRLMSLRKSEMEPLVLSASTKILNQIFHFIEANSMNRSLVLERWGSVFFFFIVNGFSEAIKLHLKTYTRDFDLKLLSQMQIAGTKRSSMTVFHDRIYKMFTTETSPVAGMLFLPTIELYQSFALVADVLCASDGWLWKRLESSIESVKTLLWIGVTADFMTKADTPDMKITKDRIQIIVTQLGQAFELFLAKSFREGFLNSAGIVKYLRVVRDYLGARRSDTRRLLTINQTNNFDVFVQSVFYSFGIAQPVLRNTALHEFFANSTSSIRKYLQLGGLLHEEADEDADGKHAHVSATSGPPAISDSVSDFQIWSSGSGKMLSIVASFLVNFDYAGATIDQLSAPESMLNVLCCKLRLKTSDSKSKISNSEKSRLYAIQNAYNAFGLRVMVIKLLNKACSFHFHDDYFSSILPVVLQLGTLMMAEGNKDIQDGFMKSVHGNIGFVIPLRHILRECIKIYAGIQSGTLRKADMLMISLVNEVLSFCQTFCGGHNKAARLFMRVQESLFSKVDVLFEIASTIALLGDILAESYIRYINFDFFEDTLAPVIWKPTSSLEKRRCIAWHDQSIDYMQMLQLLNTIGRGFRCLKNLVQGPCYDNQSPALRTVSLIPIIIEFCGAMSLTTVSKVPTKGVTGTSYRVVRFEIGKPKQFLKTYRAELVRHGRLHDDPIWAKMYDDEERTADVDIKVDVDLMLKVCKECELSCLQFSLAMMEGTKISTVTAIHDKLNYSILYQNMDNDFKTATRKSHLFGATEYEKLVTDSAVSYLSFISTLLSATSASDDTLEAWVDKSKKRGIDIASFNASVEIIGQQGDIQRIYFTIPSYISSYWPYPEVQRVKEIIVLENDRDSPEEKINSYRKNIDIILTVMARQKVLAWSLTPPVHAIFGGKPVAPDWVLVLVPRQRVILLILCLALNIYYAYLTYRERFPGTKGFGEYFDILYNYLNEEVTSADGFVKFLVIDLIQWIHFSLCSSIFIRCILNSNAADSLAVAEDDEEDDLEAASRSPLVKAIISIYTYFYGAWLILSGEWWALAMCGFSYGAITVSQWFYVPCLLEIIPQFPLMKFLVTAIRSNTTKILFTILLAILILYFYATISYLIIPDQYQLNGHTECSDLISCFKTHIDYGLNNPPNWIQNSFIKPQLEGWFSPSTNPFGYLISSTFGSMYSISYVILINLVLQAVISGVIIDTFSSMREKSESIQEDIKSGCFICSIPRDEFESNGVNYRQHIKEEHNMWKYVWLKVYLGEKDPLLFSGPEYYAYDQMQEKQTFLKLFPVKRSLSLERALAKAAAIQTELQLSTVFDVIKAMDLSQRDVAKQLFELKRAQECQVSATEDMQMKFSHLQLMNARALSDLSGAAEKKQQQQQQQQQESSASVLKPPSSDEDEEF